METSDAILYQRQEGSWVQISTMSMPIDEIPPITASTDGQYLSNDGADSEWIDLVSLPDQSGNSSKLLTTNGSAASWNLLGASQFASNLDLSGKVSQIGDSNTTEIRFTSSEIEFVVNGTIVASIQSNGDIHAGGTVIINDATPGS